MDYKSDEWKRVWKEEVLRDYLRLVRARPELAKDPEVEALMKKIGGYNDGVLAEMKTLEDNSLIDVLTGLPGKAAFNRDIKKEIGRSVRYGHPTSLILADGNGFKDINDRHGHKAGDKYICTVAEVLFDSVRKTDAAYRWGGDEFCVILPETESPKAYEVARRFHDKLSASNTPFGLISVSQGVSTYTPDAVEGRGETGLIPRHAFEDTVTAKRDGLFDNADKAMYRAKDLYKQKKTEIPIVIYSAEE